MRAKKQKSIINIDSVILLGSVAITIFINPFIGSILFWGFLVYKIFQHKDFIMSFVGNLSYRKKDYDKALNWYRKAALSKNSKPKSIKSYIFLELKHGSISIAEKVFNTIVENRTFNDIELYDIKITEVFIKWKRNSIDDCINILENLLENGENLSIYESLGYMLIANKEYSKALTINKKALEYEPSFVVLANLGETYYNLGEKDKAFNIFKDLVDKNVTFAEPFFYYGLLLKEDRNIEAAKNMFERALNCPESFLSILTKDTINSEISNLDSLDTYLSVQA